MDKRLVRRVGQAIACAALGVGVMSGAPAAQQPRSAPPKPSVPSQGPAIKLPSRLGPAGTLDYAADIAPIVARLGCAQADCHGAGNGKGGLQLSLFSGEPRSDFEALTRAGGGRRIDAAEPSRSLLLRKIGGAMPHGGKRRAAPGSADYVTLATWVGQGAPWRSAERPRLVSIAVAPASAALGVGASAVLSVTASYSDGARRDVTAEATMASNAPEVAVVGRGGRLTARRAGTCAVSAAYLHHFAAAQVTVSQKLTVPFPAVRTPNPIDALNFAHLKRLGIPPSGLSTDAVFLRRAYLDAIGLLPTPDEARAFYGDTRTDKRARLIEALLVRPEFADRWAMKWSDLLRIKSEYPVRLWPKAVQTYYRWVRQSIAENKPYDRFATELLTANGSNFRDGPANFYRGVASRDPLTFSDTSALVFMGARLGCARCHAHPSARWTSGDAADMAAVFRGVAFKPTQEWKEEVVYAAPDAVFRNPRTGQIAAPRYLDGPAAKLPAGADPRAAFAQWLTSPGNPWFGRAIANRVWYWLIGRGIVHEPDDLRPTNPPANPALLDYLASELARNGYDLRWLYRAILNSRTYQLSGATTRWNQADETGFSHHIVKRLSAEQLLDAVGQVTGAYEGYYTWIPEPFMHLPPDTRAQQVADGSIETPFLDLFGRSPRDTPYESAKCARPSMGQAMVLGNSTNIDNKVLYGARMRALMQPGKTDAQIVEDLYLAALSRPPAQRERESLLAFLAKDPKARQQALQDIMWVLLNSKEFLFCR